jgi:hypothetical protein
LIRENMGVQSSVLGDIKTKELVRQIQRMEENGKAVSHMPTSGRLRSKSVMAACSRSTDSYHALLWRRILQPRRIGNGRI